MWINPKLIDLCIKLIYVQIKSNVMGLVESFSGVRGIYDKDMDEHVALRYSNSYLSFLKKKYGSKVRVVIGTDTRPSRDILKNSVIEALDCDIVDLGIASTPMVEFGVRYYKADGGIIITASHNEPYWNGFKFLDKDGSILKPEDMDKVIKLYSAIKNLSNKEFSNKLLYKNNKNVYKKYEEINKKYIEFVLGFLSKQDKTKIKNSGLKIIIDPNGGTAIIAKQILEKLGVTVKGVNMKHGIFNRVVEPNEDSLFYLANEVRVKKYDFAAGFDCDADRVEIVLKHGLVSGNYLLALISDDILKKSKNKIVVVNDATSSMVKEIAKKYNAKYVETEVGEANVVSKMYKLKAAVGGEASSSGVIIAPSRCRDGILTLVYLLKIIANRKKNLNELIKELPEFYNIKSKIECNSKKYLLIKNKLRKYYSKKGKISKTNSESLKINLDNSSFVWFRVSKTEANVLRVIADAPDKKQAQSIMDEALRILNSFA